MTVYNRGRPHLFNRIHVALSGLNISEGQEVSDEELRILEKRFFYNILYQQKIKNTGRKNNNG
jgi:hypothetical protein